MNFYKRYPSDYGGKTVLLSLAEHGAYTLMLDWVYTNEAPLPADFELVCRICRAQKRTDRQAVQRVLKQFWTRTEDGWLNPRAAEEIAEAQPRIAAAKANGKRGGRAAGKSRRVEAGEADVPFQDWPPAGDETQAGPELQTQPPTQAETQPVPPGQPEPMASAPALHKPEPEPDPEKDKSIPTASGTDVPGADAIFGYGLDLLKRKGVAERRGRSTLGLLRKTLGDAAAFSLLEQAEREDISDPVPWLVACAARENRPVTKIRAGMTSAGPRDFSQGVSHDGSF